MKIVAIGGGEIGRPGYPVETTKIDREIIKLTGKTHPKALFIPTASNDSEGYVAIFKKHFGERLGCETDILFLVNEKPGQREIQKKIFNSDFVYVGGGNTDKLLKVWRKTGTDRILKDAARQGIVLSGLSAGSICWFKWSRKFNNPKGKLIRISGLGLISALHCPHYRVDPKRRGELKRMMKRTPGVAIALDDCSAIEVIDDKYRVLSSKKDAMAYKVYWKANRFYEEVIFQERGLRPLVELLVK